MGFGSISMIWTLAIPAIVFLYYFFRKKHEERTVPSVLFWEQSRKHTESSPFVNPLYRNALFYLQMGTLLLFVLLLMKPVLTGSGNRSEHLIIVADVSATMLAEEDGEPLMERHKARMESLIRDSKGARFTIIRAGAAPDVLLQGSGQSDEAIRTIHDLKLTYAHQDLAAAMALAGTVAGGEQADVHVFTDSADPEELPAAGPGVVYSIHTASALPENVSVVQFGIALEENSLSAIAVVTNDSPTDKKVMFSLQDGKGSAVGQPHELTIGSGEAERVVFEDLPAVRALELNMKTDDGYPADNTIHAVSRGGEELPVFAEAGLHELVHQALLATGADVTAYGRDEAGQLPEEAIVVTGSEKTFLERRGRTVLFGREGQVNENPVFIKLSEDPLFTFAQDEDIYASGLYPPFADMETVAGPEQSPLIQRAGDGRIAILADPSMTDWPLRPSFPLFLWSVIDGYSREQAGAGTFLPGESRATTPSLVGGWQLYTAEGEYLSEFGSSGALTAPDEPGLYVLRSGKEERYLAVILPEEERAVSAGPSFTMGEKGEHGKSESAGTLPVAVPLILLLLFLILAEWEVQRHHGLSY
ncbi:vWA domain-containing protein [Bhargavaea beijingensis]|uniref:vWA domain-containing protein n=1 Tax=Bhargavaea beijingensis TaxID=426756 RepID=UPI0022259E4B|nr:BatA and WFA domain-containing protein [Bhargavaea beijingensis]MCW1926782.1 BatA and WFA domain-containing protein [Bhargavaea beijingensis]